MPHSYTHGKVFMYKCFSNRILEPASSSESAANDPEGIIVLIKKLDFLTQESGSVYQISLFSFPSEWPPQSAFIKLVRVVSKASDRQRRYLHDNFLPVRAQKSEIQDCAYRGSNLNFKKIGREKIGLKRRSSVIHIFNQPSVCSKSRGRVYVYCSVTDMLA